MKYFKILIVLFYLNGTAQEQKFKFGKVSESELSEKYHPVDSSAPAAILYKTGNLTMEYNDRWYYVLEVEGRIKIYNKDGYKYATQGIAVYEGANTDEEISGLKAVTYNIVDGKIEEEKLRKDGEFYEKVNKYWGLHKFTLPNIQDGSVIEFKYRVRSPYINSLPEWKFQYDIPVNTIEYKVQTPEYLNYKEFNKGYFALKRTPSSKATKMDIKYETSVGYRSETTSVDLILNILEYMGSNIPAMKEESYVNNIDNYRSSVRHELAYTKMPYSVIKYYNQTWDDVTKTIYDSPSFGTELNKEGYYESEISALTGNTSNLMERAALIYDFVKKHMNWNGYSGLYCADGVRKAFKERVGNVAEINLMLTSMLRYAGLNANPVMVSTRSHGIPLFPTREGFNYVIAAIELEGGVILLDATQKFGIPNMLPERALNWNGRLVRKDGSSTEVNLMPSNQSKAMVNLSIDLSADGSSEGKMRKQLTDYFALKYRKAHEADSKETSNDEADEMYGNMEIIEHELQNMEDLSKPIVEVMDFTMDNAVDLIGDKIYVSPLFFLTQKENPFKLEKREYPVDFSYPTSNKFIINIRLPEGYKVESMPENEAVVLPDELGSFKFISSITGNMVQIMVNKDIKEAIIPPVYYDVLKAFFNKIVEKESQKIVLTKV